MKIIILLVAFILFQLPNIGWAKLSLDINQGKVEKIKIILNGCSDSTLSSSEEAIINVIKNDLISSGLFEIIAQDGFCDLNSLNTTEGSLKKEVVALVTTKTTYDDKNNLSCMLTGWDVLTKKQLFNKNIVSPETRGEYRKLGHIAADNIYTTLTGDKGYFNTQIAFISHYGNNKRVTVMDQDGKNIHFVTELDFIAASPNFSRNGKQIAYMTYVQNQGRVHLLDLNTGSHKEIGEFMEGMTSAPRFSLKSDKLLLARSLNSSTDIYLVDLKSQTRKKLTLSPSINTSACYSPDEKRIVFNSDREGTPQLYTMNADGSGQKRISFGEGSYFNPVWSPRGDFITFIKIYQSKSYVGIMKADGKGERLLTTGANNVEGVSWAPNGRRIIYAKNIKERFYLFSIDITGNNERMIPTPYSANSPSWSPLLS